MRIIILLSVFILSGLSVHAQSLQDQFETLKENSENYKVYKVIKRTELDAFWKVVNDSMKVSKNVIKQSDLQINTQKTEITKLNTEIKGHKEEVEGLQHETAHIQVLGIDFSKEGYIILNFTIITILLIGLALLYYKFRHDNKVAKSKVLAYEKLDIEFETYKKNSLEKQMKLRRELQTERNRIDEIRST